MNKLHFRKSSDSLAVFTHGQRLFAGSTYEVKVAAPEFRADQTSTATLSLVSGQLTLASCELSPDPLRRGLRQGTLSIPAYSETARFDLRLDLGAGTIMVVAATVTGAPVDGGSAAEAEPARWTVVDLGLVSTASLSVADMTQTKMSAAVTSVPLSITAEPGPLDAYVVVTAEGASPRFPFTGVLVNGAAPVWSHQDSLSLPVRKWALRVVKVVDDYYADLRAGRPAGVETDTDGAAVVSAEVNS